MLPLSLYIHIPWCIKKCPYCDFNSHAVKTDTLPEMDYVAVLLADLEKDCQRFAIKRPVQSIFIGGGTPSLFSAKALEHLLYGIARQLTFIEGIEITLEANPSTFESAKFAEFRALGINRLSIGVQSFNDGLLTKLGRVHSGKQALHAVDIAHHAGFDNINIDLMFGLPEETGMDNSQHDVLTAINMQPTHISFYQLTLEPNTFFYKNPPKLPSDSLIFNTQRHCQALLATHGYAQYEVSAYSKPNKQCRHNINYWQFGDYLGIGAGAHGKLTLNAPDTIYRTFKPKHPQQYLTNFEQYASEQLIARHDLPLEFMMNHLRLKTGFRLETYLAHTGLSYASIEQTLKTCLQQKLLIEANNRYYCSQHGWNFLDNILEKFIG